MRGGTLVGTPGRRDAVTRFFAACTSVCGCGRASLWYIIYVLAMPLRLLLVAVLLVWKASVSNDARHAELLKLLDDNDMRTAGRVGLEVGVWQGGFSKAQLRNSSHELHLVDSWRHLASWNKPYNVNDESFESNYRMVLQLQREFGSRRVQIHRNRSQEAAPTFDDNFFDYIYIDGDHTVAALPVSWPTACCGGPS